MPRKTKSRPKEEDQHDEPDPEVEPEPNGTKWWLLIFPAMAIVSAASYNAYRTRKEAQRNYDICEFDLQAATAYLNVKAIAPARERLVHARRHCDVSESSLLMYLVDELDTLERAAARSRP